MDFLMKKSRLISSASNREEKLNKIRGVYAELSSIPELSLVLEIAATSEKLEIIFNDQVLDKERFENTEEHQIVVNLNSASNILAKELTRYAINTACKNLATQDEDYDDLFELFGTKTESNFWTGFHSDDPPQEITEKIADLFELLVTNRSDEALISVIRTDSSSLFQYFMENAVKCLNQLNDEPGMKKQSMKRKSETSGEGSDAKRSHSERINELENAARFESLANFKKKFTQINQAELGMRLLMIAVEADNTEVAEYLVDCGVDLNFRNSNEDTVADLALQRKNYRLLHKLYCADSMIPKGLFSNELSITERTPLDEVISLRNRIHYLIENGGFDGLKKMVQIHPGIKFAYVIVEGSNQCALTSALKSKNFEI